MHEISIAMEENSKGITNAAEEFDQMLQAVSGIKQEVQENLEISDQLRSETKRFQKI